MHPHIHRWITVIAASVALSACQDAPTLPHDAESRPNAIRSTIVGGPSGAVDYQCYTSVATPSGPNAYAYKRVPLRFSTDGLHPRNATHRYSYRMVAPNGKTLRAANCVIPRSVRAIEAMNRRFGVSDDDPMQIQGCVTDGICTLEPVIVVGDGGGSGTGGTGGSGGGGIMDPGPGPDDGACMTSVGDFENLAGCPGGGDADPGEPDSWDDGTGRPACERDANGWCITRVLTQAEWDRFAERVEQIRETSAECLGAKQALRGLVAQGRLAERIRFWNGYDKPTPTTQRFGQNLSDAQGRYLTYDSHWAWEMPTLIVHEGLHYYLHQINSPLMGQDNEDWVEATAPSCI